MISIIDNYTWYSSRESVGYSPFTWENTSDQVYGAKVSSPWRYSNPNDAYEAKSNGSLPETRGEPNSQEWEYEFGENTITFTYGGNDTSSQTGGEEILRDIIKGSFDYKNGRISGTVDEFTSALWDDDGFGDEEIIMRWVANKSVKFNGLNQLGQATGRDFQGLAFPEKNFSLAGYYKTENVGSTSYDESLTPDRASALTSSYKNQLDQGWWNSPFSSDLVSSKSIGSPGETVSSDPSTVEKPAQFKKKSADKITNFNPSIDTLEIDTESFGIDSSATFAAGKNKKTVKKKLAKQDADFLYDEKKGGLYFNENGSDKGFGEGGIIAILKGAPDLTANNFKFI